MWRQMLKWCIYYPKHNKNWRKSQNLEKGMKSLHYRFQLNLDFGLLAFSTLGTCLSFLDSQHVLFCHCEPRELIHLYRHVDLCLEIHSRLIHNLQKLRRSFQWHRTSKKWVNKKRKQKDQMWYSFTSFLFWRKEKVGWYRLAKVFCVITDWGREYIKFHLSKFVRLSITKGYQIEKWRCSRKGYSTCCKCTLLCYKYIA
jgi:hypothetical protein